MTPRTQLESYIARVQRRLQLRATLRGLVILAALALTLTIALVLLLNRDAFPAHAVANARLGLFATLTAVAALALAWPLSRFTRTRAVRAAEIAHPHLEQRLTTFYEREHSVAGQPANPFLDLLAADTLARTETAPASTLAPTLRLLALTTATLICAATLTWTITSAPGFLGYGASLLWRGAKPHVAPLYALAVTPGDVAVRRNSDQLITAELTGLAAEKVQLFARYGSATAWEPVAMQPEPGPASLAARAYHFVFTGLPESVEYYVAAGPLTSPHYKVRVVDLPSVKAIRVTYHYPRWTGMKSVTEEHSGDLRALEGTDAQVEIEMDRPLKDGQLLLDDGHALKLASNKPSTYQASIHMAKDGAYHVAATDAGQSVRLSEDYFIATDKALPPEVALDRPGRDYRASPIEEVTVGVKASAQFGLNDMHLHYSVNGGPDRDVPLLKAPAKDASGAYTLRLEDFKLVPGDLVSLYATARDGHAEARTDITFIQAEPFEREFSQSQQGGGGGGGGGGGQQNSQTEISKREKELVAATWKQQNSKDATPKDAATAGQFLADAQSKLRDQVMALSARMQSRDLSAATEEFSGFEKDMQAAAAAMAPSTDKLKGMQWKDALPLEQKALQALLRAEATFRQIQVAFGQQQGGGGGGGSNSAGRDLASLFDLELDTAKNQYETAQTASPAEQHAKDVESALEKLDALAKRQEELASNQQTPQQSFEQRWQQEMLRREAEQLQRQMEQLAKNNQGQQGSQGQSSQKQSGQQQGSQQQNGQQQGGQQQSGQQGGQQQTSSSSGGQSASGSQSGSQQQASSSQAGAQGQSSAGRNRQQSAANQPASDPRIEQALSRLAQASESMKRSGGPQQDANAARQAADRLRQAAGLLGQTQQQLASGKAGSLSREAERLTEQEREQASEIDKLAHTAESASSSDDAASMMARVRERNRLAAERQELSNDLSKLQKNLRASARETAANQPGVSQKLRRALTDMDQSDLDNHVQRTADWLRRGVNPNSNGTEGDIAKGLGKLSQQLREAEQTSGTEAAKSGQRGAVNQGADQTAALGQVQRLRSQLEAMSNARNGQQPGQQGRGDQPGQGARNGQQGQNPQVGNQSGDQPGQSGSQSHRTSNSQQAGAQPGNQPGQRGQQGGQSGAQQSGSRSPQGGAAGSAGQRTASTDRSGEVRTGGGGSAHANAWNNVNTGNNTYGVAGPQAAPTPANNPADTERTFQQSLRGLNQLRGMVGGDPQAAKEVADLTRRMQQLDPKRFPGNPALVEQLHREMLSAVDSLELRLQRNDSSNEARSGKPFSVPAGYDGPVADYYRRLSSKP